VEVLAERGDCKIHSCDIQNGPNGDESRPSNIVNLTLDLQKAGLEGRVASSKLLPVGEPVDLVVLNAAVNLSRPGLSARHIDLSDSAIVATVEINLVAPLVLTTMCLRHNAELKQGPPSVIYLCSLSTIFSYPGAALYGATKDALSSYSKALRWVVKGRSEVVCAFPGPLRTDMTMKAAPDNSEERLKGRMAPQAAAEIILGAVANAANEVIVAGPMIQGMAQKARGDHKWAAAMMRSWQFIPLLHAKATE
jgi:short-subunit dehydrogenase